jgi:hypothetical protein
VHQNHIHPGQLRHILDLLHRDIAEMADQFDLEVAGLLATIARTQGV